jgi:hypothetical protein
MGSKMGETCALLKIELGTRIANWRSIETRSRGPRLHCPLPGHDPFVPHYLGIGASIDVCFTTKWRALPASSALDTIAFSKICQRTMEHEDWLYVVIIVK